MEKIEKSIAARIPLGEDEFYNAHEEAKNDAFNVFDEATSTLDSDDKEIYRNELGLKIENLDGSKRDIVFIGN